MGDVEKSIHITDKKNNIDLNIYDKGESFTFEFSYNVAGAKMLKRLSLDEDFASILFVGLNEIYGLKDDEEEESDPEEDISFAETILNDFFDKLNKHDKLF